MWNTHSAPIESQRDGRMPVAEGNNCAGYALKHLGCCWSPGAFSTRGRGRGRSPCGWMRFHPVVNNKRGADFGGPFFRARGRGSRPVYFTWMVLPSGATVKRKTPTTFPSRLLVCSMQNSMAGWRTLNGPKRPGCRIPLDFGSSKGAGFDFKSGYPSPSEPLTANP